MPHAASLLPRLGVKPDGSETVTVLLAVSPSAWVIVLVIAAAVFAVAGETLKLNCGAYAADAGAAATNEANPVARAIRFMHDRP